MDIDLATTVTVTGSDISGNTTNIFIPSSATGTITFTGNTFGAALGSSLATYKIINDSTAATLKVQD